MLDLKSNLRNNTTTRADNHNKSLFFSLYALSLAGMFLLAQLARTIGTPTEAKVLGSPVVEPSEAPTASLSPTPEPTEEPMPEGTDIASLVAQRPHIERYIKEIFGRQAQVAIAIARAESGLEDPTTKEYFYRTYAINESQYELSVGLFQVNIRSEAAKVHWARVPGHSEEEKIEWLKDPYNNTLLAYWIYDTSSFGRWTTYSSGKYLAFLK